MLELSKQQWQELRRENAAEIRLLEPETQQQYVLLRAEVYDRLKQLLVDDGDWTPEEQLRLLAESGNRAGWDNPEMDVYDHYDENRKSSCP